MNTLQKLLLGLAVLPLNQQLFATTITGLGLPSDHPALINGAVIDFESDSPGFAGSLSYPDVTMTGSLGVSGDLKIESLTGFNTTGQHISLTGQNTAQMIRFDFSGTVNALGMNIGGTNKSWTLSAFSMDNLLLESLVIPLNDPSDNKEWYGLIASGISYATLVNTGFQQTPGSGTQDYITIDNFTFNAVPVPTPAFLFGAGLLGLGLTRKKSNHQHS